MARMVPMGIDFWASRKSPERLEPAMIPGGAAEKKNYQSNKQKETKKQVCEEKNTAVLTGDRREVDADQQSEKGGDVIDHVGQVDILAAIASSVGEQLLVVYQLAQTAVL